MENRLDETKFYDIQDTKTRWPCPFYGFILPDLNVKNHNGKQIMEEKENDSCALAQIINSDKLYCHRESLENKPCFAKCDFNTEKNREKIFKVLDKIVVFPKKPKFKDGISLKIWMPYVIYTFQRWNLEKGN